MLNYAGKYAEYCDTCQSALTNYEQRRGREVLHREANNELHNSDEKEFMKWLVLTASDQKVTCCDDLFN